MFPQCVVLGLFILALSGSAAAVPLAGDPSPGAALPPVGAPVQSKASIPGKARPTPAQLDQPGAVAVASPNERNTGTTVASPDPAFFGRLNLHAQPKPLEQPPALQVAPGDAAKSGATGNTAAPPQAPN
jgi:hypothetical protein